MHTNSSPQQVNKKSESNFILSGKFNTLLESFTYFGRRNESSRVSLEEYEDFLFCNAHTEEIHFKGQMFPNENQIEEKKYADFIKSAESWFS